MTNREKKRRNEVCLLKNKLTYVIERKKTEISTFFCFSPIKHIDKYITMFSFDKHTRKKVT